MTPDAARSPRGRPRRGISLGRWFGVPVLLDVTWVLLAVYVTLSFVATEAAPLHSPAERYTAGIVTSLLLAASVLLHELAHAVTAQALGLPVRRITLYLLGGVSEMTGEARSPAVAYLVAIAGPATSVLLAAGGWAIVLVLDAGIVRDVAQFAAVMNALLAVFNLLPGLPLDGGQALRAAVWHVRRDAFAGAQAAAVTGRVLGAAMVAIPLGLLLAGRKLSSDVIVVVAVGLYISASAGQALVRAKLQRALPSVTAARFSRRLAYVPVTAPVSEMVRHAQRGRATAVALVDSLGRIVALVDEALVTAMPEQRRPWVTADEISQRLERWHLLDGRLAGEALVDKLRSTGAPLYLVMDGPTPHGMLVAADVAASMQHAMR